MPPAVPRSPAPFEGEDGYLVLDGLRHHYLRWGAEGDDPLVLLHGLMSHGRYWEHIAQEFATDHEVFAPDLRGHGETDAPGDYRIWEFAQDLQAALEQLGIETFDLVAHSLGSRVAMAYAREHSHRISKLVLVDMGPEITGQGAGDLRELAERHQGFADEAEAVAHFEHMYPSRSADFYRRQIAAGLRLDEATGRLVFRFDPALRPEDGGMAAVEVPFLWECLAQIKCPTLVVRAEKSRVLSREMQEKMVRTLPRAIGVEIPDAGHQLPLHQPAEFIKVVRKFLAG